MNTLNGNVWEWCQDEWQEDLGTKSVIFSASLVVDDKADEASKVEQSSEKADEE